MGGGVAAVTQPVLLDNTILTNFALVKRAELVTRLWRTAACTTAAVVAEYAVGVAEGLLPADAWTDLPVVELTDEEEAFAERLSPRLGAGERTCLAVAHQRQGLFASDDLDARRAADQHRIPRTGSIGILVSCVRRGLLSRDEAESLLGEMIASGYRSPVDHLGSLIDRQEGQSR
jgi:predicted nucleic acid-binding protein